VKGIRTFLILALCAVAAPLAANTYTVTSVADSGAGSLRQAILDANGNPGADAIAFAIVGSGVQTIKPATNLPSVSESVVIDGYTQSGSAANTNGPGLGSNAVLKIEISGELLPQDNTSDCLKIAAAGVTVKGLSLYGCFDDLMDLSGADGTVIVGNFLGVAAAGVNYGGASDTSITGLTADNVIVGGTAPADRNVIAGGDRIMLQTGTGWQIRGNVIGLNAAGTARPLGHDATSRCISSSQASQIGGTTAAARNVIAGCDSSAILAGDGDVIQGNFIGTDATGTHPINNKVGIQINVDNVTVGGSTAGAGNVIAASKGGPDGGIAFSASADNAIVQGNWVGTDQTATIDLGNEPFGIVVGGHNHKIGGINPGEGNVIAFNGGIGTYHAGVQVAGNSSSGISIRGNRIFANTVFGIDIAQQQVGPAPVDDLDADTGPNGVQNFPFVDSVDYGASTTVHGRLTSAASAVFDVDFYASPACAGRPPLYPQGPEFVGTTQVTTDASGHGTFDAVLDVVLAAGQPVTAIATDPAGSSSEFSNDILFVRISGTGPAEGGSVNQIYGHLFDPAATVTVGGVPATAVTYVDSTHLSATMPAVPPGSVNDIVVTNPGGRSGTRPNGWVAEFLDNNLNFALDVAKLVANEITVGVGGGNYGYLDNIKRQQMAVFLLKGKHGVCYVPPPCAGLFPDVPCPSTFANWIEAMANEGITGGCGGGNFCPGNPVRRDQMAVFLLKAHRGSDFVPPDCTGHFPDVQCPSTFANWIEELSAEGVTAGCGGGNYCPTANNTRGQMATFMVRTFSLQAP
jgi:hypothetical protein